MTDLDNQIQAAAGSNPKPPKSSNAPAGSCQSSTITTAPNTISPRFARSPLLIGQRSRILSGVMTARLSSRSAARAARDRRSLRPALSMRRARAADDRVDRRVPSLFARLSAWKQYGLLAVGAAGEPPSGNLHPTEAYIVTALQGCSGVSITRRRRSGRQRAVCRGRLRRMRRRGSGAFLVA